MQNVLSLLRYTITEFLSTAFYKKTVFGEAGKCRVTSAVTAGAILKNIPDRTAEAVQRREMAEAPHRQEAAEGKANLQSASRRVLTETEKPEEAVRAAMAEGIRMKPQGVPITATDMKLSEASVTVMTAKQGEDTVTAMTAR